MNSSFNNYCNNVIQSPVNNNDVIGYRSPSLYGHTSPGQGRSVREIEEQMTALRKENFNLKLRIYFLEEKVPGYNSSNNQQDGHEISMLKQNVDLKVDNEVLRKELQEKQAILCEAATAIDLMEQQEKTIKEQNQAIIDELNEKIRYLEAEVEKSNGLKENNTIDQLMGRTELGNDVDNIQKIRELDGLINQYKENFDEQKTKISEMEVKINEKEAIISDLEKKLKQLDYQNAELQEQFDLKTEEIKNYEHLKSELSDYKKQLADKLCTLEEVETKLQNKIKENEKACTAIQKLLKNIRDLQKENEILRKTNSIHNFTTPKEITNHSTETPVLTQSCSDIGDNKFEWNSIKTTYEMFLKEKNIEIENLKEELKKKTTNLQKFVNRELFEKNRQFSNLAKLFNDINKLQSTSSISISPIKDDFDSDKDFSDSNCYATLERNKVMQKKINTLIQQLFETIKEGKNDPDTVIHQLKLESEESRQEAERAFGFCKILKDRLEELAGFLDSLLSDNVLRELAIDKRQRMQKAVNRSLEMSSSLNNMSLSKSRFSLGCDMKSSLLQLSCMSDILNTTFDNKENQKYNSEQMLEEKNVLNNELIKLKAEIKDLKAEIKLKVISTTATATTALKKDRKSLPVNFEKQSESEAWSEPDRKVSLARIGLEEPMLVKCSTINNSNNLSKEDHNNESTTTASENDNGGTGDNTNRKTKLKASLKKINSLEQLILERDNQILNFQTQLVDFDNRLKQKNLHLTEITRELDEYKRVNEMLEIEIAKYKLEENNYSDMKSKIELLDEKLYEKENLLKKLQEEKENLNINYRLNEMKLETLKINIENMKLNYEKQLEENINNQKQKLNNIEFELNLKWEEKLKKIQNLYDSTQKDLELLKKELVVNEQTIDNLEEQNIELKEQLITSEKRLNELKKKLDETTIHASNAVLERTKAMGEKLHFETITNELNEKYSKIKKESLILKTKLMEVNELEIIQCKKCRDNCQTPLDNNYNNIESKKQTLAMKITNNNSNNINNGSDGYISEDVPQIKLLTRQNNNNHNNRQDQTHQHRLNNSSPDLGIESDAGRTSSAELANTLPPIHLELVNNNSSLSGDEDNNNDNSKQNNEANVQVLNIEQTEESGVTTTTTTAVQPIIKHDCLKIEQELQELKRKYKHTKRSLQITCERLKASNQMKEHIEKQIKLQVAQTNNVLETVSTNLKKLN